MCVVYCLDAHFITDVPKYIAGAMQVRGRTEHDAGWHLFTTCFQDGEFVCLGVAFNLAPHGLPACPSVRQSISLPPVCRPVPRHTALTCRPHAWHFLLLIGINAKLYCCLHACLFACLSVSRSHVIPMQVPPCTCHHARATMHVSPCMCVAGPVRHGQARAASCQHPHKNGHLREQGAMTRTSSQGTAWLQFRSLCCRR